MPMAISKESIKAFTNQQLSIAPLLVFRIVFGLVLAYGMFRFWYFDWIEKLYLEPQLHFSYLGFEWVKPFGDWTYLLFILCGISAIGVAVGFWYRISASLLFLSFTYIELMDKTTYLNHYYFVSMVAFILIFLPAAKGLSADAGWSLKGLEQRISRAYYLPLWALVSLVYFYAGLAKLNSDWLLHAQPLKLWLPGAYDLPLLGPYLEKEWVAFFFSWAGAAFDLSAPFLLWFRKTRPYALFLVVVFHLLTRLLFPIGLFPLIMVLGAFTFLDHRYHQRLLIFIGRIIPKGLFKVRFKLPLMEFKAKQSFQWFFGIFIIFQLVWPWRYLAYPGELFWHEQGFRFSWRVMLMEKAGYASFTIVDTRNKQSFRINNADYLSSFQEKQMSFQPDFILEYAHYLAELHRQKFGHDDVEVYADVQVALNGRSSQPFIDKSCNLAAEKRGYSPKKWILPFNDTIYGI